jgi:hypothetical protein
MRGLQLSARSLLAGAALLWLLPSTGCVGVASQLMYFAKGNKVPAEFDGLKHKRVAVVCASPNQTSSAGGVPQRLAEGVGVLLSQNVKGIKVVSQDEVRDWIDRNDWDQIDYKAVGRGVKADMIVEIKLTSFSVNEGSAFFKGRANAAVNVYDMAEKGKAVFRDEPLNFEFPRDGVKTSTETTEARFQTVVIRMLSESIAKNFYAYEKVEDFGNDARFLND